MTIKLHKHPDTNLMVIKPVRRKPRTGDIFVCNMRGERWIAGRVVHMDCLMMSHEPGQEPLIYFYKMPVTDPTSIRVPIEPNLLLPPIAACTEPWSIGLFMTVDNAPLLPEERLSRHVFLQGLPREKWNDPDAKFCDEYCHATPPPRPGELWERSGMWTYRGIDNLVSQALGVPLVPWRVEASEQCGSDEVILIIPGDEDDSRDIMDLEQLVERAIEGVRGASIEGHGQDMAQGCVDIRVVAKRPKIVAASIALAAREWDLPKGSYMLVGGRKAKRVDLA